MNNNSNGRLPLAEDLAPVTTVQSLHTLISDAARSICLDCGEEIPYEKDRCGCQTAASPSRGSSWGQPGQLGCEDQHEPVPTGVEISTTVVSGSTQGVRCPGNEMSSREREVIDLKDEQHLRAAHLGTPFKVGKEDYEGTTEIAPAEPETSCLSASGSVTSSPDAPAPAPDCPPAAGKARRVRPPRSAAKGHVDINTRGRSITYRLFVANEIRRLAHQGAQARNKANESVKGKTKPKPSRLCSGSTACVAALMLERLFWCCGKFGKEDYYRTLQDWANDVIDSIQTMRSALEVLVLAGLVVKTSRTPEGRRNGNAVLHLRLTPAGRKLVEEERRNAGALKKARQERHTMRGVE